MASLLLHADRTRAARVPGSLQPWCASPDSGVDRSPLDSAGGEVAPASPIVRQRADAPGPQGALARVKRGQI